MFGGKVRVHCVLSTNRLASIMPVQSKLTAGIINVIMMVVDVLRVHDMLGILQPLLAVSASPCHEHLVHYACFLMVRVQVRSHGKERSST
jgi:hypothetical protein